MADPRRVAAALSYQQPSWLDAIANSAVGKAVTGFGKAQKDQLEQLSNTFLSMNPLTRPFVKGTDRDAVGNAYNAGQQIGQSLVNNPKALIDALKGGAKSMVQNVQTPEGAGYTVGNLFSPVEIASGLSSLGKPLMREITAYHGTPHTFPPTERNPLGEFDSSKIGTGEGAQAYGHGLYLAESPDVANSYITPNLGKQMDAKVVRRISKEIGSTDPVLVFQAIKKEFADVAKVPDFVASIKTQNDVAQLLNSGSLYQVDLPDPMIEKMLDWDKPLSEQPASVREAAEKFLNGPMSQLPTGYKVSKNFVSGKEVYQPIAPGGTPMTSAMFKTPQQAESYALEMLNEFRLRPNTKGAHIYSMFDKDQKMAADMMQRAGIPGIKYLDAGSRSGDKGTRNFVVFPGEEANLKILERK